MPRPDPRNLPSHGSRERAVPAGRRCGNPSRGSPSSSPVQVSRGSHIGLLLPSDAAAVARYPDWPTHKPNMHETVGSHPRRHCGGRQPALAQSMPRPAAAKAPKTGVSPLHDHHSPGGLPLEHGAQALATGPGGPVQTPWKRRSSDEPAKIAISAPSARNGPKGTRVARPPRFATINPIPTAPPMSAAR